MQSINNINTIDELNKIKDNFLLECENRKKKIIVSEMLSNIVDFITAKSVFESVAPYLLSKKGGKELVNSYTRVIKENKSLRTLYTYNEGLNENKTTDSKKTYIIEALKIGDKVNNDEYIKGMSNIISLISESFNLLGDDFVLENVKINNETKKLGESLCYLTTMNKSIKNINEYMRHIDNVSGIIYENKNDVINSNLTLDEIASSLRKNNMNENVDDIFNNQDKEGNFEETKKLCLEMLNTQKHNTADDDIIEQLSEIENKLSKKQYTFETYTKDMLYMTELQEVLK